MKGRLIVLTLSILNVVACGGAPTASVATTTTPALTGLPTPALPAPTLSSTAAEPAATLLPTEMPSGTTETGLQSVTPAVPQDVASRMDLFLNEMAKKHLFAGSVLVAQGGKVLLQKGYGFADREKQVPNDPQTKFRLGSITKQFTAMAILMLQAQDKLAVEDHICKYLADCPSAWQSITIHQLLTHTSGIPDFREFPDYQAIKKRPTTPLQTIAHFKDKPLEFKPGARWSYSDSGYIVLGAIVERASGRTYEEFVRERIFVPLDMANSGYEHKQDILATGYANQYSKADDIDMSVPYAAGGLYSTVEDLYRWDQALYTDELIPEALLKSMFSPAIPIPDSDGQSYGYGWVIGKYHTHRVVGHPGVIAGFSTLINRYPDDRVCIILLSNQEDVQVDLAEKSLAGMVFDER